MLTKEIWITQFMTQKTFKKTIKDRGNNAYC